MRINKQDRKQLVLTTHIETFLDNIEEMKTLNLEHYLEISEHVKHAIPLDPDYSKYMVKEQYGELLYIALRHQGKLVGYYIGFIGTALHYRTCLQCSLDIFYVGREVRGQNAGVKLLNHVLTEAKRRGVRLFTVGFKDAHSRHMEKLLKDLGMQPFERHYCLWL